MATDAEVLESVRKHYGYASWALYDPELGPILRQAAAEEPPWSQARIKAAIEQTNWWKQRSQTMRTFEELQRTDPATAQQSINSKLVEIRVLSNRIGIPLTPDKLNRLAVDALRYGWSSQELQHYLGLEIPQRPPEGMAGGGDLAAYFSQVKATAANYLLTIGDNEAWTMATRLVSGELGAEGMGALFQARAKARWPALAQLFDQGITPSDYFAEHKAQIARTLELPDEGVDLINDQRWQKILDLVDKNGLRRPMTVSEATQFAREQDEWQYTRNAHEQVDGLASKVLEKMGALG